MNLMAGFECGFLPWNAHDLLVTTRHTPETDMAAHYAIAAAHGLGSARDGLPWRHDPTARMAAATGDVIWDLSHYDVPPDAYAHGARCASAADPAKPFWICPTNEPMLYPLMSNVGIPDVLALAGELLRGAEDHHGDVRVLTTDPIVGAPGEYRCTDAQAERADIIGCNLYPNSLVAPIHEVLIATWERYGKPLMIAETSWHAGHPDHHHAFPHIPDKAAWLRHVLTECEIARRAGADVQAVCWYPVISCPPWDKPDADWFWDHGLIQPGLCVDPALSAALAA